MEANIRSMIEELDPPGDMVDFHSVDAAEQTVIEAEREIARLRAIQLAGLDLIDKAQVFTADGARNMSEWVAARLDLGLDTARGMVRTMRRTQDRPQLRDVLRRGEASFDRVEAASKIDGDDPDPLFEHLDIHGVQREAATRIRIDATREARNELDRYLVVQPTLDQSWWRVWGGFDGLTGAIIDQALNEAADQLPAGERGVPTGDSSWRRATALAQICVGDNPPPAQITLFVDAGMAAATDAEAGVYLQAGPRVGRLALEALLFDSVTEVILDSEQAEPMRYGRRSRTIPPALRRALLRRDGNRCVIDGCDSRHRLQIHHIIPWSRGGRTDPQNLITVCWFHHHIAIHQRRLEPYRHPDHGRCRLRLTGRPPPD